MTGIQMGQYPPAQFLIAHLSDTHFLGADAAGSPRPLYGRVDTDSQAAAAMRRLRGLGVPLDAIVVTGDIADLAEDAAYRRVRALVEPVAEELGAALVWVMGNHDERSAFRRELLRAAPSAGDAPVDSVDDVRGLRIITLDSTVPGYHHGEITPEQLGWLRGVLATPAPHGSILALHHPPIPTPLAAMTVLELQQQQALADVIRGSDVRAILAGHLHYSSTSLFAGVPVSVAAATCYTMDVAAADRELVGVNGGQSMNLVHVYADRVVHSVVPLAEAPVVTHFEAGFLARLEALDDAGRRELFSRKTAEQP
ncbi:metallophosphoesterase [Microterricola viridarii]|uniref:Calcineurin-like phosphoesterase n=1 Tax=Microterricola viridarii TaxID=412690 RepID=A0A1H1T7A2_9MICO|nr:metallophosphoesterase [Microterricola viridarii]SDS56112.1 Calcineurin-like phosphoesterase [Microterricola viridarii]